MERLIELCTIEIPDQETRSKTIGLINKAQKTQNMVVPIAARNLRGNLEGLSLAELVKLLAKHALRDGEFDQAGGGAVSSSKCMFRGGPNALAAYPRKQQSPRVLVSTVLLTRHIIIDLRRNSHIQGILRMKSSAIS